MTRSRFCVGQTSQAPPNLSAHKGRLRPLSVAPHEPSGINHGTDAGHPLLFLCQKSTRDDDDVKLLRYRCQLTNNGMSSIAGARLQHTTLGQDEQSGPLRFLAALQLLTEQTPPSWRWAGMAETAIVRTTEPKLTTSGRVLGAVTSGVHSGTSSSVRPPAAGGRACCA
eukprot:CAMPEP_0203873452 /NCGR_PEP_ID=MMETSP0359-20131031/19756_1 /ASSEMBLY_ACC=CAM_ASM_000338 /TAXON_ID=268821 /ORGANISM="Scrippsiella Hangoei, Strain SHTV-5" /LENGTH=167 /DNA_ID=CAMNT_0050792149 /DNA_START=192 /DNA_END=696 /DNA_ORIENTATION=+